VRTLVSTHAAGSGEATSVNENKLAGHPIDFRKNLT